MAPLHLSYAPLLLLAGAAGAADVGVPSSVPPPPPPPGEADAPSQPLGAALVLPGAQLLLLRTLAAAPGTLELRLVAARRSRVLHVRLAAPVCAAPALYADGAHGMLHLLAASAGALHRVSLPLAALAAPAAAAAPLPPPACSELALPGIERMWAVHAGCVLLQCDAGLVLAEQARRGDGSGLFEGEWAPRAWRVRDAERRAVQTSGRRRRCGRTPSCAPCRASSRAPLRPAPAARLPPRAPPVRRPAPAASAPSHSPA